MSDNQCLAIIVAILFHVKDTNPPHGIYESQEQAMARTLKTAKVLLSTVQQS